MYMQEGPAEELVQMYKVGSVIEFKGLVGLYVVKDVSLVGSDKVIGARKVDDPSKPGVRYERLTRVVK